MKKFHVQWSWLIVSLVGLLMVAGFAYGAVRFRQLQMEVQKLKTNPQALQDAAKADTQKLVGMVAKLIAVPGDETPTVATVTDSEKLKTNAFFVNAKNGDKVLIYSGAKKAIIYRPDANKIIEVGPVSIGTPSSSLAPSTLSFALYNGTTATGLTNAYEKQLKAKVPSATVLSKTNAKKTDYTTSVLVGISKAGMAGATALGKTMGISVGELPEGEVAPTGVDYLIILGADAQ